MFLQVGIPHPLSLPLWEALSAPKQMSLNHFVSSNKRELCAPFSSSFCCSLLHFPSLSHLTSCLFLEQENPPPKTFLSLRKQFVLEFYNGSLEQEKWPTNIHSEVELCTEKSSGTEGSGREASIFIRGKTVLEYRSSLTWMFSLLLKIYCNKFVDFTTDDA